MISSWTRRARDNILSRLLPADQAMLEPGGLVDAFEAVPVSLGNDVYGRLEAVGMVTLVTAGKDDWC